MGYFKQLISSDGFMPHGQWYHWDPGLVWLHVVSDALIALAYFAIPLTLIYYVRKRRDFAFNWILVFFAVFILASGTAHLMEVWLVWHPAYWLSGVIKAATALVSLLTAGLLMKVIPRALLLPSRHELRTDNTALAKEIRVREQAEKQLESVVAELRLLQDVALAVNAATDVDSALQFALDRICKQTGWPVGHAYVLAENGSGELVSAKLWHLDDPQRFTDFRNVSEAMRFLPGEGLPGRVLISGARVWIVDVTKDDNFPRAKLATNLGVRAAFGFPILVADQITGVLEFFAVEAMEQDEALLQKMSQVGTLLGRLVERKRAEASLRESEARLRATLNTANDAFVSIDENSTILDWNPQAERIFGWSREEAMGRKMSELIIPPRFREGHHRGLAHLVATGEGKLLYKPVELAALNRHGEEVPVELTIWPTHTASGHRFNAFVRDLTEKLNTQKELEIAMTDLRRSNEELEQFAYVASHDLQEPLRMVANFTQLLELRYRNQLDDEARSFISFAVEGAKRMQQLITDLLEFSRVGTRGKQMSRVDVNQVMAGVRANLRHSIDSSGARVTNESLPIVIAEPTQLGQLLQNLIENAIKFRGEQSPHIHLAAVEQAQEWVFSVRDNGIGIEPEYFKRIFIIFQRLHSQALYSGTGIGLAVCKRIVERHGGRIWVESDLGKGSVFYFSVAKQQAETKS